MELSSNENDNDLLLLEDELELELEQQSYTKAMVDCQSWFVTLSWMG